MTWLRPVDRTSGTLTLSAGALSCLVHHGTPLSERWPTTTALEHTTVPMDNADRYVSIRRSQAASVDNVEQFLLQLCSPLESGTSAAWLVTGASRADGLTGGAILERVGRPLQCGILAGLRTGTGHELP
jgi:hypothetical protein